VGIIFKNMVTDFGAVGDGVTSNAVPCTNFNTWALVNQGSDQINLTFPAGTYDIPATPLWVKGVKDLVVEGPGVTILNSATPPNDYMFLSGELLDDSADISRTSYFQTVVAGSSSITLVTPSESGRYAAGDWVLLVGNTTQKTGWPPNNAFFEYAQVLTSSAGVVTFTAPLKYSYKSTWPYYGTGGPSDKNAGGPATIFGLSTSWPASFVWRGSPGSKLIFGNTSSIRRFYANALFVRFQDAEFRSSAFGGGIFPTASRDYYLANCAQSVKMECDKSIENLTISGGPYGNLWFQSSSGANLCTADDITADIQNTPKKLNATNSTIGTFNIGGALYGPTKEVSISNSAVSTWLYTGSLIGNVDTLFSMSGGVITVPKASETEGTPWAVPGAACMFARYDGTISSQGIPFRIEDVWDDAINVYVRTNLSRNFSGPNGFPDLPRDGTTGLSIWNHPCPSFTATNLTGSDTSEDLSQWADQGKPIFSRTRRIFNTAAKLPPQASPIFLPIFGQLVSIKINVTKVYSGVHSPLTLYPVAPFVWNVIDSNDDEINYWPTINFQVLGERIILPGSVSGLQSGDSVSVPGAIWIEKSYAPTVSADISGESSSVWPSVTIEILTDHGIVSDIVDDFRQTLLAQACM